MVDLTELTLDRVLMVVDLAVEVDLLRVLLHLDMSLAVLLLNHHKLILELHTILDMLVDGVIIAIALMVLVAVVVLEE